MEGLVSEEQQPYTVRDVDLLRVLVALAGRIVFPLEQLSQIVGSHIAAYNMCTGELSVAAIARATTTDKSNLRKTILRWEEAGVIFRVGSDGRPLGLYTLPVLVERGRSKKRVAPSTASQATPDGGHNDAEETSA